MYKYLNHHILLQLVGVKIINIKILLSQMDYALQSNGMYLWSKYIVEH